MKFSRFTKGQSFCFLFMLAFSGCESTGTFESANRGSLAAGQTAQPVAAPTVTQASSTPSATPSPAVTPVATPVITSVPAPVVTASPTTLPSILPTATPLPSPSHSPSPTPSPSAFPSPSASATPSPSPSALATSATTIGVYSDSFEQDPTWYITSGQPTPLQVWTNLVGKSPQLVMWFQDWVNGQMLFNPTLMTASAKNGANIIVTWEPHDWNGGTDQPSYSLSAIIAGQHDAYIHQFAQASKAWGHPFIIRLMHEMNGGWYSWSENINGNTPALYIQAWKHIVDIFRADGATQVKWAWVPNIDQGGMTPMKQFYPGDSYVDWIGLDGYNYGTSASWSQWTSLKDLFLSSYQQITAVSSKPLMIGEVGCAEQGGDKGAWITQGFLTDIPQSMPLIKAVTWFNLNKEADWRVNSSTGSFNAFEKVIASPLYSGTVSP